MVIIYGESALAYWRTPPVIKAAYLAQERATAAPPLGAGINPRSLISRCDASEGLRAVQGRILTDLKGIPLPIHIAQNSPSNRKETSVFIAHLFTKRPPKEHLHELGNGLFVASPALALAQASCTLSPISLLKCIFEFCGIYAIAPRTSRVSLALKDLMDAGAFTRSRPPASNAQGLYGFEDENGKPLPTIDEDGDPLEWSPCLGPDGGAPSLWKRPALTSTEEIFTALESMKGLHGRNRVLSLLKYAVNGSGSPLETIFLLFCCLPPRLGGEHWRKPLLNRRIVFDQSAQRMSKGQCCYADCLWEDTRTVIEIDGAAYHANENRFQKDRSRTAALEAMGYSVINVTHAQLNDLDALETRLKTISRHTGMPIQRRTVPFILHREALHRELFPEEQQIGKGGEKKRDSVVL